MRLADPTLIAALPEFEVDLTMWANNALDLSTLSASNPTIGSDCAGQTLSYDLVLQSSMYGPG